MKVLIKVSLVGLLMMGLLSSCNPEKEENENLQEDERNYTETAFGIDMRMVYVEGGVFEMGVKADQGWDADEDETPVHTVTLDSYYIGKYEVTQAQWKAVMGTEPSYFKGDNLPVENVSWADAMEFCKRLSDTTGKNYVLPTEAMWEYAALGGSKSKSFKYSGSNRIGDVAWYEKNSKQQTHPVGIKKSNELGINDMSGNVWEWCSDWLGKYDESDTENPQGPAEGTRRVVRGGSWYSNTKYCRVSFRYRFLPSDNDRTLGFRVAVLP